MALRFRARALQSCRTFSGLRVCTSLRPRAFGAALKRPLSTQLPRATVTATTAKTTDGDSDKDLQTLFLSAQRRNSAKELASVVQQLHDSKKATSSHYLAALKAAQQATRTQPDADTARSAAQLLLSAVAAGESAVPRQLLQAWPLRVCAMAVRTRAPEAIESLVSGLAKLSALDTATCNAALDAYRQLLDFGRLRSLYAAMPGWKVARDVDTFATWISTLARREDVVSALYAMSDAGLRPNERVFEALVSGGAFAQDAETLNWLLEEMRAVKLTPSPSLRRAIVVSLASNARDGQLGEAERQLAQLRADKIPLTADVYNAMISAYSASGRHDAAFAQLRQMRADGVAMDADTYLLLMRHAARLGVHDARLLSRLWDEMITTAHIAPDARHYALLIQMCIDQGAIELATRYLLDLRSLGLRPLAVTVKRYLSLAGHIADNVLLRWRADSIHRKLCPGWVLSEDLTVVSEAALREHEFDAFLTSFSNTIASRGKMDFARRTLRFLRFSRLSALPEENDVTRWKFAKIATPPLGESPAAAAVDAR